MHNKKKSLKRIGVLFVLLLLPVLPTAAEVPESEMEAEKIQTESIMPEEETEVFLDSNEVFVPEIQQKQTRTPENAVVVDAAAFPDPIFREYVLDYIAGKDGVLSEKERNSVKYLEFYYEEEMTSLKGIEYFPNLEYLYLDGSKALKTLDLRKLKQLKEVHCEDSGLTSLKVNGLSKLKKLFCSYNQLKSLNLSGLSSLEQLECNANELTALSAKKLSNLKYLLCRENAIRELDLSGMTKLQRADCEGNAMTSLKLQNLPSLTVLLCGTNHLKNLDLSGAGNLTTLYCYQNQLEKLDCTANPALYELEAFTNQLKELNLSGLTNLASVNCSANAISVLDVSAAKQLNSLIADDNAIPALNLSKNKKLKQASFQNQIVTAKILRTVSGYQTDFTMSGFKKKKVTNLIGASLCKTGLFWSTQAEIPQTVSYTYKTGNALASLQVTVRLSKVENWNPTPKKVNLYYARNKKKGKILLKWNPLSDVDGYEIYYSTSAKFKVKKTTKITISKAGRKQRTIKNLKKGKTYYVRICAYKKYNGKIYYGTYSNKKKVKIKIA